MEKMKARLYFNATYKARKVNPDEDESSPSSMVLGLDIESIICYFIYEYLKRPSQIEVRLIAKNEDDDAREVEEGEKNKNWTPFGTVQLDNVPTQIYPSGDAPAESHLSRLPAIVTEDEESGGATTVISGLCSVCRTIAQLSGNEEILGFKRGCLAAPAEASVWTKFCEIDILRFLEEFMETEEEEVTRLDDQLARFEMHLRQPVRIHNVAKVVQDLTKLRVTGNEGEGSLEKDANDVLVIKHQFVEGPRMFLADLMLFCVFYFVFRRIPKAVLVEVMPLTVKWYETMEAAVGVQILDQLCSEMKLYPMFLIPGIQLPSTAYVSLYKSDPKRYKPRKRIFTKQGDIEVALEKIELFKVDMINHNELTPGKQTNVDWSLAFGMPEVGDLPKSRLERKQEQLKSVAREVIPIARPGHVIVDFCSGSGHLGILLASLLPQCQIILLENKAESLDRAKVRSSSLGLSNVLFLQTNLDYFRGPFNIGVSLHACGVATDIVMALCLSQRAHFVCCPCCYGAVLDMPHISYPRSEFFRQREPITDTRLLNAADYFCIAHGADQSHAEVIANTVKAKCDQGQLCMDIVDYDRRSYATEQGYKVHATKLEPVNCTQKNRLLIGISTQMNK